MTVAYDQRRLSPHHWVADRHGDRMIRLATAGPAFMAVDRRLPASAGARTGVHARAVARGAVAGNATPPGPRPPRYIQAQPSQVSAAGPHGKPVGCASVSRWCASAAVARAHASTGTRQRRRHKTFARRQRDGDCGSSPSVGPSGSASGGKRLVVPAILRGRRHRSAASQGTLSAPLRSEGTRAREPRARGCSPAPSPATTRWPASPSVIALHSSWERSAAPRRHLRPANRTASMAITPLPSLLA